MSDLTVRELKQTEWDGWDRWLALQPWGSFFSSSWWLGAHCRAFGGHLLLLGVLDGEQLVGGVALRIVDTGLLHVVRVLMPYNPIVIGAGSAQRRQQVLAALLEDMTRRKLVVRPIRCTPDMVDLREAVWHHWDLTVAWTVMQSLKTWAPEKDVSREELKQLRKAQRSNVTVRVESPDADILYDLRRATVLRHGPEGSMTRAQLHTLVEAAGADGIQFVARDVDGVALSAGFVMAQGTRIVYDMWAGTSLAGLTKGSAVARYVFMLNELQARGYEYFDWCDASLPGYSDFKLKFGGTMTICLAIARGPQWLKALIPVHVLLLRLKGVLRRR